MAEEVKLDYDFLIEMFKGCLSNKDFLEVVLEHCKESYLPEGVLESIFKEIKIQYKVEEKKPTVGTLKLAMRKSRQALEVLEEIKNLDSADIETLLITFEDFIKSCKFIEVYNKVAEDFSRGKSRSAYSMFAKGAEEITNFSLSNDMFESVFADFPLRQANRLINTMETFKVPTGIDELDRVLNGGPESGEFWCYLAASKGGKSFLINHLGLTAARMGFGVAHFQAEGTRRQVFNRYDAAWSGSLYHDIKNGEFPEKKYKAYKKIVGDLGGNDIHVYTKEQFGSMNMIEIRKKVIDLKKKYNIGLVMIDYWDLINPDGGKYSSGDERFRQQRTGELMKDLAIEQNVVVVSPTQAVIVEKDMLNDPDFVLTREHLAEFKGKIRPVDGLISLNRTNDDEENNICKLYIEAAREYKRSKLIYIKQNLDRSRFYDRNRTLKEIFDEEMS